MYRGARLSSALKPSFVKNIRELSFFKKHLCCFVGKCELLVSCLYIHNQKTRKWVWWVHAGSMFCTGGCYDTCYDTLWQKDYWLNLQRSCSDWNKLSQNSWGLVEFAFIVLIATLWPTGETVIPSCLFLNKHSHLSFLNLFTFTQ